MTYETLGNIWSQYVTSQIYSACNWEALHLKALDRWLDESSVYHRLMWVLTEHDSEVQELKIPFIFSIGIWLWAIML